ncbi:MAG: hypothetical protein EOO88_01105 [Pedobacter sp.]|nr:MAG: hypothetical protein EOO88_01105 [Pedobacter sp.]
MELDDRRWARFEGGYRMPYDASKPLRRLRDSDNKEASGILVDELWEELHHQGDVGLVSYLSVPHIIKFIIANHSLDSKLVGLVVCIENSRLAGNNPELPAEFDDFYFGGLMELERYLLQNFKNIQDPETLQVTLALLATVNGLAELGRVIEFVDQDLLEEFINDRM